ncbi:MAG: hypothetical protein CMJ67_10750 [Planctomycetaceae bacterium]|nr:hypothetical protein [Planctomycetaceae bacterium]
MSKNIKIIEGKDGNDVEVVTRAASKRRQARESQRPMFGGPESVIGERVQKDLDNTLMYASLDALMNPQGE